MLFGVWIALGTIAAISTTAAGWLALTLTPDDDAAVIVTGTLGFVAWAVWTYGSLNIEYPIEGDPGLAFSEPAVTLVGVACAFISGLLALTGPIEIIARVRDTDMTDI